MERQGRASSKTPLLENNCEKGTVKHPFPMNYFLKPWKLGQWFYQVIKIGIVQYMIIKSLSAILAVILEAFSLYCEGDFKWGCGYPYMAVVLNFSQSWALYCLVQFYTVTKDELEHIKPLAKFLTFKSIVFLTWWQGVAIALLYDLGLFKSAIAQGFTVEIQCPRLHHLYRVWIHGFEFCCNCFPTLTGAWDVPYCYLLARCSADTLLLALIQNVPDDTIHIWDDNKLKLRIPFHWLDEFKSMGSLLVHVFIPAQMGIASIVHLYVFPAKPYELMGDRLSGSVSVLGDYASTDPLDPDEVRDSERPTKLRLPHPDIDIRSGMTIGESVRDVFIGGGGYIVNDVKFTVNQAVEPVEKGITKFNQKLHKISQNIKRHDKEKRKTKDDSCITPIRRVIRGIDDPLLNGALVIVGSQGERSIVENQDIPVEKVGEKAAVIKVIVHIRSAVADGLPKIR
ncbi:Protein LAZ1 [Vitis vinifera]|uniref:Protein LAZ1 n=1 Tax=Vitis vinifera TaxID=29760 RepID=A0A438EKQ9_VITVI|nr:Protein LAZ1 [Vitis vinifera]